MVYEIETTRVNNETTTGYQPARNARLGLRLEDENGSPHAYEPNCYSPKKREDAELCAQWSSVETAEQANRLSTMSIKLSALQFGALVLTLVATGWAAWAAARAADVAAESAAGAGDALEVARQNAQATARLVEVTKANFERQFVLNKGVADRQVQVTEMQLRAYVSVVVGSAIYQDRALKFEARPEIVNMGLTPAKKLRYAARADILPVPLPADYQFAWAETPTDNETMIPGNQNRTMRAVVDSLIDEDQVPNVRLGIGKSLYIWGIVEYEDAFGKPRETRFCQQLTWLLDAEGKPGMVMGYYIPGWNSST